MSEERRGWVVMRPPGGRRWGGEIRRHNIFARLAERTHAQTLNRWPRLRRYIVPRRWQIWRQPRPAPYLVSAEQAPPGWALRIPELAIPIAVAIYDDQVAQLRALGVSATPERIAELKRRKELNRDLFHWIVVPTASFAELAGLPADRVIVGGNGTDTRRVRPGPWPTRPAIGMAAGAAPGRGIEMLIEAARLLRGEIRDLRLDLWLLGMSETGEEYIADLRAAVHRDPWVKIAPAPYSRLGSTLAKSTLLAVPHPPNEYMDVALPVKVLDSMAAGRPLVVTPRTETAAIVNGHGVGLVAGGDTADDFAAACRRLLEDAELARDLGRRAREVAVREFDWPVVGERIAVEILRREGMPID